MQGSRGFVFKSSFNPHGGKNMDCKCEFMPGIQDKTVIEGYDPEELRGQWQKLKTIREETGLTVHEVRDLLYELGFDSAGGIDEIRILEMFKRAKDSLSASGVITVKDIAKEILEKEFEASTIGLVFKEAATIEEASKFAIDHFGVNYVMFKEIGLSGANVINEALTNIYNSIGFVGLRDIRYKANIGDGVVAAYNPSWGGIYFSKMVKSKNAKDKIKNMSKKQLDLGFWSTGSEFTPIYHEVGHHVHNMIDARNGALDYYLSKKLEALRKDVSGGSYVDWHEFKRFPHEHDAIIKKARDLGISGYSLVNERELVAESFAQVFDGSPSDEAIEVVKIVLNNASNASKSQFTKLREMVEKL